MSGRVETDYSEDKQGRGKGRTGSGHNPSEDEMLREIIVRIPKPTRPIYPTDFSPITLLNADDKFLASIISSRTRPALVELHLLDFCHCAVCTQFATSFPSPSTGYASVVTWDSNQRSSFPNSTAITLTCLTMPATSNNTLVASSISGSRAS